MIFELRKHTFFPDTPVQILGRDNIPMPMPQGEQIVISTLDGDAFAIVEGTKILLGLCMPRMERCDRIKIKLDWGAPTFLTSQEIYETPVGYDVSLIEYYRVSRV